MAAYEHPYPSPEADARYPFDELDFHRYPESEMLERARGFYSELDRRRSVRMLSDEPVPLELIELAVHTASTAPSAPTLTHTPSPMAFLSSILERRGNERPFVLFPVGYPVEVCRVPRLRRKALDEVMVVVSGVRR